MRAQLEEATESHVSSTEPPDGPGVSTSNNTPDPADSTSSKKRGRVESKQSRTCETTAAESVANYALRVPPSLSLELDSSLGFGWEEIDYVFVDSTDNYGDEGIGSDEEESLEALELELANEPVHYQNLSLYSQSATASDSQSVISQDSRPGTVSVTVARPAAVAAAATAPSVAAVVTLDSGPLAGPTPSLQPTLHRERTRECLDHPLQTDDIESFSSQSVTQCHVPPTTQNVSQNLNQMMPPDPSSCNLSHLIEAKTPKISGKALLEHLISKARKIATHLKTRLTVSKNKPEHAILMCNRLAEALEVALRQVQDPSLLSIERLMLPNSLLVSGFTRRALDFVYMYRFN
jgi:hypothetical protein